MKTKSFKIVVAVLAILLVAALTFGITGAFYTDRRAANGTLKFDGGITIQYSGLSTTATGDPIASADKQEWVRDTSLFLFKMSTASGSSVVPGQPISYSDVKLSKGIGDAYVRAKLVYTCYDIDNNVITPSNPALVYTQVEGFDTTVSGSGENAHAWYESDGWYYLVNNSTSKTLVSLKTTEFAVFKSGTGIKMSPLSYPGYNGEASSIAPAAPSGGYQVSGTKNNVPGTYTITKVTVELVVDAIQANSAITISNW